MACWGGSSMNQEGGSPCLDLMIPQNQVGAGVLLGSTLFSDILWSGSGMIVSPPTDVVHPDHTRPEQLARVESSLDSYLQDWTKTSLASGELAWAKGCTSVQASHCFLQVFMSAVLATAFLNWPQSQRINSQMWYSLVTKNSGLVYREDKGETAWLQNTLLR